MVIKKFTQGEFAIVELSYENIRDITNLLSICKEDKSMKSIDEKLIYLEMGQLFELIKHGTITEFGHDVYKQIYAEIHPTKDTRIEDFIYNVLDEIEKNSVKKPCDTGTDDYISISDLKSILGEVKIND